MRQTVLLLLLLLITSTGCQIAQLGLALLPDYGRWKYDEGWEGIATPYPNAIANPHVVSREKLFTEVYEGYAIIDSHLVGLRKCGETFLICAPWAMRSGTGNPDVSDQTIYNGLGLSESVVGHYHRNGRATEVLKGQLRFADGTTTGPHATTNSPTIRFRNSLFHVTFQNRNFRLEHPSDALAPSVELPLRGRLRAMATQKDKHGKELLFVILQQDAHAERKYALLLLDETLSCLGFCIFPPHLDELSFVKDRQGNLFIVPLNALCSLNEGIIQLLL